MSAAGNNRRSPISPAISANLHRIRKSSEGAEAKIWLQAHFVAGRQKQSAIFFSGRNFLFPSRSTYFILTLTEFTSRSSNQLAGTAAADRRQREYAAASFSPLSVRVGNVSACCSMNLKGISVTTEAYICVRANRFDFEASGRREIPTRQGKLNLL